MIDGIVASGISPTYEQKQQPSDLAVMIDQVATAFREKSEQLQDFFGPVKKLVYINPEQPQYNGRVFFGIHKDRQVELEGQWTEVKAKVLEEMGLDAENTYCVQVVGDSQCYDEIGTTHNRGLLHARLHKNAMILWGFTGRIRDGGRTADVNGLVNEFIIKNPTYWADRCLANVVSYHSKVALGMPGSSGWGCDGSHLVKHFWMVFGDDDTNRPNTLARFGADVPSSDNLSEEVISLEGGIQSLNQVIRCLSLGQKVAVSVDSRGPNHEPSWVHSFSGKPLYRDLEGKIYYVRKHDVNENAGTIVYTEGYTDIEIDSKEVEDIRLYTQQHCKYYGDFFSVGGVARFFQEKAKDVAADELNGEIYRQWWQEYTSSHLPSNPKARDFETKKQLLFEAEAQIAQVGDKLIHNVLVEACPR